MRKLAIVFSAFALLLGVAGCNKDGGSHSKKVPEGAVDLGIVITREDGTTYKLYWAKSNLNFATGLCANPEDYGDYYAWGETVPKERFEWSNYKWCDYGDQTKIKKYYPSEYKFHWGDPGDGKSVLDEEDDAAHVKLGGKWRIPTKDEWNKLKEVCSWKWSNKNGVNGYTVMGPNGNEIFLPAAGVVDNTDLVFDTSLGYYWSSNHTMDKFSTAAYDLNFADTKKYSVSTVGRQYGCSIRPVSE